jgi:hypothetical protein
MTIAFKLADSLLLSDLDAGILCCGREPSSGSRRGKNNLLSGSIPREVADD